MRVLLVGNPTAQSGKAQARIDRARDAMEQRGWTVAVEPTAPAGKTIDNVAARLASEAWEVVVYLGGDGTFREVAAAVVAAGDASDARMGMLPSGTANDQGKSFGVSARPEALETNLDIIAEGNVIQLDVGEIERRPSGERALFFDSVGFGFQARILERRNEDREKVQRIPVLRELYRDIAVYAGATLQQYALSFTEATKFDADVVADGQAHRYEQLIDLVIKATAVYGGQWVLDRNGAPDDGRFELVPFLGRRDWVSKILRDLKDVPLWQEHLEVLGLDHGETFSGARFEVKLTRTERPAVCSQIDGEEWLPGDHFLVTVREEKVPLLTPGAFVPPWAPPD
jgi:diacylglycerol kinase family enzyme